MFTFNNISQISICLAILLVINGCQKIPVRDGADLVAQHCERIADGNHNRQLVIGPEDIAVEPGSDVAYISASDRWGLNDYYDDRRLDPPISSIFRYRPDTGELIRLPILPSKNFPELSQSDGFYPHGIDLYRSPSGDLYLLAVNHPVLRIGPDKKKTQGNAVVIFRVKETGTLEIVNYHDIKKEEINANSKGGLNDIIAVDKERFYVSFNTGLTSIFGVQGSVLYFDGQKNLTVLDGLKFANGLAMHPNGDRLFVADSRKHSLKVFQHPPVNGRLIPWQDDSEIELSGLPDNLSIDWHEPQGWRLLVALHRSTIRFLFHSLCRVQSPSEVIAIPLDAGVPKEGERLFLDKDGTRSSGTSAAVRIGQYLLLGNVFEKGFLQCRL